MTETAIILIDCGYFDASNVLEHNHPCYKKYKLDFFHFDILTVDELIQLTRLKLFLFNPNSDLRCEIYGDKKNTFWIEILYFPFFGVTNISKSHG